MQYLLYFLDSGTKLMLIFTKKQHEEIGIQ